MDDWALASGLVGYDFDGAVDIFDGEGVPSCRIVVVARSTLATVFEPG